MAVPSSRGRSATPGDVKQAVGPPAMTRERLNQAGYMSQILLSKPSFVKSPVKMFRFKMEGVSDFWI